MGRLVRTEKKAKKLVAKPQYLQHIVYNKSFAAIQLKKNVVKLDKPRYFNFNIDNNLEESKYFFFFRYIGMCVLDISKLIMYEFHYDFKMKKYPGTKLLFSDTDSFCYWIPSETNVYDDIKGNAKRFDFSNYPLITGKMNDKMGGELILEFDGLRAKMYSILNCDGANKKTAKGVITQVKNDVITHEDFKSSLYEKKKFMHTGTKIVQIKHQLYTTDVTKVTLSPFNDKKWITRAH